MNENDSRHKASFDFMICCDAFDHQIHSRKQPVSGDFAFSLFETVVYKV